MYETGDGVEYQRIYDVGVEYHRMDDAAVCEGGGDRVLVKGGPSAMWWSLTKAEESAKEISRRDGRYAYRRSSQWI
jgi:hypothetical protein